MGLPNIESPTDCTTREICQRCNQVSAVGFFAQPEIWAMVAGQWRDSILCLTCFARLGDEKHVAWETGMQFFPVSYASHHAGRTSAQAGSESRSLLERCQERIRALRGSLRAEDMELLADLRRELGKE